MHGSCQPNVISEIQLYVCTDSYLPTRYCISCGVRFKNAVKPYTQIQRVCMSRFYWEYYCAVRVSVSRVR